MMRRNVGLLQQCFSACLLFTLAQAIQLEASTRVETQGLNLGLGGMAQNLLQNPNALQNLGQAFQAGGVGGLVGAAAQNIAGTLPTAAPGVVGGVVGAAQNIAGTLLTAAPGGVGGLVGAAAQNFAGTLPAAQPLLQTMQPLVPQATSVMVNNQALQPALAAQQALATYPALATNPAVAVTPSLTQSTPVLNQEQISAAALQLELTAQQQQEQAALDQLALEEVALQQAAQAEQALKQEAIHQAGLDTYEQTLASLSVASDALALQNKQAIDNAAQTLELLEQQALNELLVAQSQQAGQTIQFVDPASIYV